MKYCYLFNFVKFIFSRKKKEIVNDIPQGYIFGPLSFCVYTCVFQDWLQYCWTDFYADTDTLLLFIYHFIVYMSIIASDLFIPNLLVINCILIVIYILYEDSTYVYISATFRIHQNL